MAEQHKVSLQKVRVRVFVDYWNFQLNLRDIGSTTTGNHSKFGIDWKKLGPWLTKKACEIAGIEPGAHSYDGMAVYSSFDPSTESGREFRKWATTWLNRQPGIDVKCLERKAKNPPRCPTCHRQVNQCPHADCGKPMKGTVEKGVDTFIATDMIRLAWEEAYDLAVLV